MYNLEYHKALDHSHILPNLLNGAISGIISQFLSDIIISLLLENENIILNDIKISEISQYYASMASGMVAGVLLIYLDPYAVALFSTIAYNYVFELVNNNFNTNIKFNSIEIIDDTIETIILLYLFDPTSHIQYRRYEEKRHFIEPDIKRTNKTTTQLIFFIVLTNTYNFFTKGN